MLPESKFCKIKIYHDTTSFLWPLKTLDISPFLGCSKCREIVFIRPLVCLLFLPYGFGFDNYVLDLF